MNIPVQQGELTFTEPQKVVRLRLTSEQEQQLAPLAIEAGQTRENTLFISVAAPFWSREEEATIWELQTVKIKAKSGAKVVKVISERAVQIVLKGGS